MGELDVEIAMQVEDEMGKVVLPVFVGLHYPVPPCSLWLCGRGLAAAMTTDTDYTQEPHRKKHECPMAPYLATHFGLSNTSVHLASRGR